MHDGHTVHRCILMSAASPGQRKGHVQSSSPAPLIHTSIHGGKQTHTSSIQPIQALTCVRRPSAMASLAVLKTARSDIEREV
eukprot:scaffold246202_cov21-Tisochrysis_lutea.AAC.2